MSQRAADPLDAAFRAEWGRLLAKLVRWLGDLDLAEEVAADAVAIAVERWPADGMPDQPAAWLLTTARRRAVDVLRRRRTYAAKLALLAAEADPTAELPEPEDPVGDDRLRLFFTCCHPALAPQTRVAMTLRYGAARRRPGTVRAAGGDRGAA